MLDSDWGTAILHPMPPPVLSAVVGALDSVNPWSGRRLPGLLSHAGLRVVDIGSQALVRPAVPEDLVGMLLGRAVSAGAISESDRDTALAGLRAGAERGDFHMSVTMFAVVAVHD